MTMLHTFKAQSGQNSYHQELYSGGFITNEDSLHASSKFFWETNGRVRVKMITPKVHGSRLKMANLWVHE